MKLEELVGLRGELATKKDKLTKINCIYNERLADQHLGVKKNDILQEKLLKASAIYTFLLGCFNFTLGTLLASEIISSFVCLTCALVSLPVSRIIYNSILTKIIYKKYSKDTKEVEGSEEALLENLSMEELYEKLCETREEYHNLESNLEKILDDISIEEQELYQEYLKYVDEITNQTSMPVSDKQPNNEPKKLNLLQ